MFMTYLATISCTSATFVQLGSLVELASAGIRCTFKSAMCRRACIGAGPRGAGVLAKAIARGRGIIGWMAGAHRSQVEKEIEEP